MHELVKGDATISVPPDELVSRIDNMKRAKENAQSSRTHTASALKIPVIPPHHQQYSNFLPL